MVAVPLATPNNNNAVYALIIGINHYQAKNEYSDLQAAVGDADTFEEYIIKNLDVPAAHIINLRDEQASRRGILRGFDELLRISGGSSSSSTTTNDGSISEDAAVDDMVRPVHAAAKPTIIIYYAGHGARTEKPTGWATWATNGDHIEMLCPSDIGVPLPDGRVVEGIPDRTVCAFLNRLSAARGNNITLILDCCCSAGLNRSQDASFTPRRIEHPPPISSRCDIELYTAAPSAEAESTSATRGMSAAQGFAGLYHDSHVLMAACGREQQAYERDGHGLFTQRLLATLDKYGVQAITYDSLLARLRMPSWQTPHFEGKNLNRLVFNNNGSRSDPHLIPGHRRKKDDDTSSSEKAAKFEYILEAGLAQGIEPGAQFAVHRENTLDIGDGKTSNPPLGTLVARAVHPFSSTLAFLSPKAKFKVPPTFYARWSDTARQPVHVYCADTAWVERVLPAHARAGLGVRLADTPEAANLVLTVDGGGRTVHFDRNDTLAQPFIGARLPHTVDARAADAVHAVIRAWRHFYYHLLRPSPRDFPEVRMELNYLAEEDVPSDDEDEDAWGTVFVPTGGNLIAAEPAFVDVKDTEDEDCCVGMTLYNDSDVPLYPYLFYFDPSDLTITIWPATARGAGVGKYSRDGIDCPLPPHSRLPLGYGNGGVPWQFELADGKDKDVGFFKLFITDSPANFTCIEQDTSPFSFGLTRGGSDDSDKEEVEDPPLWGSKIATVVQLRAAAT